MLNKLITPLYTGEVWGWIFSRIILCIFFKKHFFNCSVIHSKPLHSLQQDLLIELLLESNEKAMPLIYDKYSGALYGIIIRILKNEELASEILQDTFLKVWQKRSYYRPEKGRLYTWMMNIARNLSINALNSKASREREKIHPLENNVYYIESPYNIKDETLDMNNLLAKLDKKYRRVIDLAYFQGYTQKEISEKLEMPLGSVKSCVKIALRELKELYVGKYLLSSGLLLVFNFLDNI